LLYEPIESLEGIGIEANDNENIQSGYMQSCEPKIMQKKQEVALKNATSLQIGYALWTVTQLLQQHHAEVISIKEQLHYIKERLSSVSEISLV